MKAPYWQREREQKRKAELKAIRKQYGSFKEIPSPGQARILRKRWKNNDMKKLMDYCHRHRLNPNSVIADLNVKEHGEYNGWAQTKITRLVD